MPTDRSINTLRNHSDNLVEDVANASRNERSRVDHNREHYFDSLDTERRRGEEAIRKATVEGEEAVRNRFNRLQMMEDSGEMRLEKLEREIESREDRQLNQKRQIANERNSARKEEYKISEQKMNRNERKMKEAAKEATSINSNLQSEKNNITKVYMEKRESVQALHHQKLLELKQAEDKIDRYGNRKLDKLAERRRVDLMEIDNKNQRFVQSIAAGQHSLMSAVGVELNHESYKKECGDCIRLFNILKDRIREKSSAISITIDLMKTGKNVSSKPNFDRISVALGDFERGLQNLPSIDNRHKMTVQSCKDEVNELNESILKLQTDIKNYEKNPIDLTEVHKSTQNSILKLSKLVADFNIPNSKEFSNALKEQMRFVTSGDAMRALSSGEQEKVEGTKSHRKIK